MKTNQNGFIAGIIIGLVIWGLVAFFIIKAIPQPKQPTYTATDSIARDRLLNRIDTIKVKETIWKTSNVDTRGNEGKWLFSSRICTINGTTRSRRTHHTIH